MPAAIITSVGCYTPPGVLTNHDLSQMVETTDQWILDRTGISTRHIAPPEMATSDMAIEAAKCCLSRVGVDPAELDAIILCTVTPDHMFPSTVCIVQHKLGAKRAWGFDLIAACSGFVYGLTTAANFIMAGTHKKVLVIGADTMSRIIDYTDRATCVLFGDGAGAMLVEPGEDGQRVPGLHERDRRLRRGRAEDAGGRQPHAADRGDRCAAAALREAGRPGGIQVRRPQHVRTGTASASTRPASRPRTSSC